MVNQMLFEYEVLTFDGVQKGLFERFGVYFKLVFKDGEGFDFFCFVIDFFIGVDLFFELVQGRRIFWYFIFSVSFDFFSGEDVVV